MSDLEFLFVLLIAATLLVRTADLIGIPYPIVLVIGGLGLGFVPFLPIVELEPEVVLLVFLPPLLTRAAFMSSPQELRVLWRPLTALALGLVLVTMTAVALVAHALVDGLPWAAAFTLGAIVGPTDPVSAIATFSRAGAPEDVRRMVEGEALLNDASSLTAFRVALGVATGATFDAADAVGDFVVATVGGVAVGLFVGWLAVQLIRRQSDPLVSIVFTLLVSYGAYVLGEELGVSGVLGAVLAGLFLGWHSHTALDADTRLSGTAFWEVLEFVLNALLFILLGLQFPALVDELRESVALGSLALTGLALAATVIVVRLGFQFVPGVGSAEGWRSKAIVGWAGMRGAISLALVLSVPLDTPFRNELVLLTFVVIGVTLVGQGLTLPLLVRVLDLPPERPWSPDEAMARLEAAQSALDRLEEFESDWEGDELPPAVLALRERYRARFRQCQAILTGESESRHKFHQRRLKYGTLRRDLIDTERAALLELRNAGQLRVDVFRKIERDLDLEEARL